MELDHIAVFVRVVESGSFTRAARDLGVPTSTVSRTIARLEDALGTRLLQRTTRTLALTPEGAAFHAEVAPALAILRDAAAALSGGGDEPRGVLRLTAPNDLGDPLVGDICARFVARYPEVRVEVELTSRTVDIVAEGFDVALRAGPMRDSSLVARKISELGSVLVASPAYLERRGVATTPAELAAHDCVLFRERGGHAEWRLVSSTGEEATVSVTGRITGDDFSFVGAAVRAGAGISFMPLLVCRDEIASGRLVRVLPDWERVLGKDASAVALHLVHASSKHLPRKVAAFRDFLLERCSAETRPASAGRGNGRSPVSAPTATRRGAALREPLTGGK